MTEHAEIRERLELAAVEPDGLDRLTAGDTPEAAAIAGHLVGCPACAEEARRLATIGPLLREAAAEVPPDALRDRTLALVRETGRPRGATAPSNVVPMAGRSRRFSWPAAIAAALAIVLVGGGVLGIRLTQDLQDRAEALAELNTATLRVSAQPDATLVALRGSGADSKAPAGTLLFSPSTTELVVSAPGLAQPSGGQELACWVTRPDGSRARMGKMEFSAGLAYWTGWSDALRSAGPGTVFGVTAVDAAGKPVGTGDLLTGTIQGG